MTQPAPPASDAAHETMIRVENLGKRFKIYRRPADRMIEWATWGRRVRHRDFWAVRGVSFEVRRGGCLGVIGANGSGKSTLLKMLAGALFPTEGSFRIRGRVLSLIELGTGLNPMLSGRTNIVHAAALLGFPPGYAREKTAEIEAFAELGEFFDRPVQVYSTGMRVRLAFSMFACFRPEVFMVDEALSVGDVFFQQKCSARLRELLDAGMTMLFVSHDQGAVLNLCDRAILLEHGRPTFEGPPAEALARYTAGLRGKPRFAPRTERAAAAIQPARNDATAILAHDVIGPNPPRRFGTGDLRILATRVTDAPGRDATHAFMGHSLTFHVLVEAACPIDHPRVGIKLLDRFSNLLFACGTRMLGHTLPPMNPGDRLAVRLDVVMDLAPGPYTFAVGASTPDPADADAGIVHDEVGDLGPIHVILDKTAPRPFYGAARLKAEASHAFLPVTAHTIGDSPAPGPTGKTGPSLYESGERRTDGTPASQIG
jgi:lipopolysaccharide transport system ATP-binding protein